MHPYYYAFFAVTDRHTGHTPFIELKYRILVFFSMIYINRGHAYLLYRLSGAKVTS